MRKALSIALASLLFLAANGCAATKTETEIAGSASILSAEDVRHLLSRTGLGVSPSQLRRFARMTRTEAIEAVMAEFTVQPSTPMPAWVSEPLPPYHARADMSANDEAIFNNERDLELAQLKQWWTLEMLQTPSPQTERLVLFWHDVFATSYYDTDQQSLAMARQNQTFRKHGLGSWRSLLKAMIRDPALLEFLDAGSNHKDSPNENLARELLELFTLGEGNYTEATVKEAARALTGHDSDRSHNLAFRLKTWQQDRSRKNLFGVIANHDGDDLIDQILNQPDAARFLSFRFWNAFVSDSEPNAEWIEHIVEQFRKSDYQIAALYRAMLESDEFWSAENRGSMIKSPVDLLIGTSRSLEYPKHQWHQLSGWLGSLDMELFAPPNVSGWSEGGAFVTPGRLLNRYAVIDELISGEGASSELQGAMQMNPMMAGDEQLASRLNVRLAAEDFKGPAQYKVVLSDLKKELWASEPTVFAFGHDTEKMGGLQNQGDAVWVTQAIAAPDEYIDAATQIEVVFLNDAAGPGGDRNLYVDGIDVDDKWFSSSNAMQRSGCEPELSANAGRLYCEGSVRFKIRSNGADQQTRQPLWSASAVHVEWARDNVSEDSQTVYITLDHFKIPDRYFNNFQFSLIASKDNPVRLRVESFGCWPSCLSEWPESAWIDEHFTAQKTLAFPLRAVNDPLWVSERALASHWIDLKPVDKQLVSVLWRNASSLLKLADETPRAERFNQTLKKVAHKLESAGISVDESVYADGNEVIRVDARFLPPSLPRSSLQADRPSINNQKQLIDALASASVPVHQLLAPQLPGIDLQALSLNELVQHPVFQLK